MITLQRRIAVFAILLSALGFRLSAQAPAARGFPSDADILAIIKKRVEEKRSAGIVVGILEANGKTRVISFGDPGPGKLPLDGNTVFEIGSISKVFTGTMLAQMVLEGKVKLDDPVQQYLPSTVKIPERGAFKVTLGNLSTQTSGLPRMPDNFAPKDPANPYADYTEQQMYTFLSGHTLRRDPGSLFEYSNLGVGLLGHALSRSAGTSYEQLVTQRILTPLGMTRTAITLSPWMKEHLALGHDANGDVTANWDIPTLAGAGALRSTANDMLKFVAAAANTSAGPLAKAMAFAQETRASAGGPQVKIGLNWITRYTANDTLVWHNGGTGGYRTFAGVSPSRKVGVVVLTNSGGAGADDIGIHLLDPSVPLAPPPPTIKQRTAITVAPAILAKYVGEYQLAPQAIFEIKLSGDTLSAKLTGQGWLRIWPETETDFFYKEVDAQLKFVFDARGNVTALTLFQNGQQANAPKVK
jgi:D-alanyl-D-alanine-carboxypeptidase/D-alanyl-D-alanine-endopeptidase